MGCCSRTSVALLSWGLGVLAVSLLSVTIMFGGSADEMTPDSEYSRHNPAKFIGMIFDSSISIAFFGCIGSGLCILCLVLTVFLEPKNILGLIVSGLAVLFTFATIISEGCFYNGLYREATGLDNLRNQTKLKDYIVHSIEVLYKQAYENFRGSEIYKTDPNVVSAISWDDYVNKYLGKLLYEGSKSFQYSDLWTNSPNSVYYTLSVSNGYIVGSLSTAKLGTVSLKVASLMVNDTSGYKQSIRACWNTSMNKYDCKVLSQKQPNSPITLAQYGTGTPFTVGQYIVSGTYINSYQPISVKYLIDEFPYGFNLLNLAEISKQEGKKLTDIPGPFVYTTLTNYYTSGNIENYLKLVKKSKEEIPSIYSGYLYWCTNQPTSFDDTIIKCVPRHSLPTFPLPDQNIFLNVGVYGSNYYKYYHHMAREMIFNYSGSFLGAFGVASLIIQIFGIFLCAGGKIIEQFWGEDENFFRTKP